MNQIKPAEQNLTPTSRAKIVEAFLDRAIKRCGPGSGRLIFALDATMSRQPTWDQAIKLQADMFREVAGLTVQLVYYRGQEECQASSWVARPERLGELMSRIDCRGGYTQIARILAHARREHDKAAISALVFVGDAMEESLDDLCARAGALRDVAVFMFQEGAWECAMVKQKKLRKMIEKLEKKLEKKAAKKAKKRRAKQKSIGQISS
jgi:ribosomal protein L17